MKVPLSRLLGMLVEWIIGYKQMSWEDKLSLLREKKVILESESGFGSSAWSENGSRGLPSVFQGNS